MENSNHTIIYKGRQLRPVNGHKCDEQSSLIQLADGTYIEHPTPTQLKKLREEIVMQSVACSICGHAAIYDYKLII